MGLHPAATSSSKGTQSAGTLRDVAVEIEQFRFVVSELIRGARQLTASSLVQPRRRLTT